MSALVCLALGWRMLRIERTPELPVLATVPDFQLTERNGSAVNLNDLKGQVWIADFIFTNCAESCPMMTSKMKELQDQLNNTNGVKLVSISVDPNRDTPAALQTYAEHNKAGKQWLFLTGEENKIHHLIQKGFLLAVQNATDQNPILHSQKFVLVDQDSRIRGYYDADDPQTKKKLVSDVRALLNNGG
jgi:cytochrome oxidase Cu insertion factor (SCO1/SenC/PrrC family)